MNNEVYMNEHVYKSKKTASQFIARGEPNRAFLIVDGEASTVGKVVKEVERIRVSGADFATVDWTARMLSNTF